MAFTVREELQVQVNHVPGALARVLRATADAGIHVHAFVGYAMGPELGFVHLVPSDLKKAKSALKKAGFDQVRINKVVAGTVRDRVGSAAEVAERAAQNGINLEAAYASGTGKGTGVIVLSTSAKRDVSRLAKVLS